MDSLVQRFSEAVCPAELLTTRQVAESLSLSPRTLDAWRRAGKRGPAWLRVGSRVRYRKADVTAWLESLAQRQSAEAGAQL